MYRNVILSSIFELEGSWSSVSNLPGDRGGFTQGGISSSAHPEYVGEIEAGALSELQVKGIYLDEYYTSITGYYWLELHMPEIMSLLYHGKVHGAGVRQYTLVIQRFLIDIAESSINADGVWGPMTFNALKNLEISERAQLWEHLISNQNGLILERVRSVNVSALSEGIRNRVLLEFDLAHEIKDNLLDSLSREEKVRRIVGRTQKRELESVTLSDTLTIHV